MGKFVRIFIAIIVVLSFVVWAKSESAGAANPGSGSDPSLQSGASLSAAQEEDEDCKDDKNKNKDKCKCKDKSKGDDDDCGTVKPPKDDKEICKEGSESVGGVVIVHVTRLRDKKCVKASTKPLDPAVDQLPPGSGTVVSNVLILTIQTPKSKARICFAVPPLKKKMKIYSSSTGAWLPIKTNVNKGMACAEVTTSGKFVLVAQ
jgi:hypothetical protein